MIYLQFLISILTPVVVIVFLVVLVSLYLRICFHFKPTVFVRQINISKETYFGQYHNGQDPVGQASKKQLFCN